MTTEMNQATAEVYAPEAVGYSCRRQTWPGQQSSQSMWLTLRTPALKMLNHLHCHHSTTTVNC